MIVYGKYSPQQFVGTPLATLKLMVPQYENLVRTNPSNKDYADYLAALKYAIANYTTLATSYVDPATRAQQEAKARSERNTKIALGVGLVLFVVGYAYYETKGKKKKSRRRK